MTSPGVTTTDLGIDRYDTVGVVLVAAFAGWTVVSAMVGDGNPLPQLALLITATGAYVMGRVLGRRHHAVRIASVIVLVILGMTAVSGPAALAGGPLDPPLGYGNANGALYALGVAAAAITAKLADRRSMRRAGAIVAVVLLILTALTTSKAATILAAGILLLTVGAHRLGRWVVLIAPALVLVTIAVTAVVGMTHDSRSLPGLEAALTGRRAELWQDALDITAQEPIFGVGPAGFAYASPTARGDLDARWAHSGFLQTAAEIGIPGAVLLVALVLFTLGALYRSRQDLPLVIICATASTAFAVHAAIDYVLHFPALVIITALLAGIASNRFTLAFEAPIAKGYTP